MAKPLSMDLRERAVSRVESGLSVRTVAEQLGVSASRIGWIVAIYSLAQLIFAPVLGRLSDRFGRRPIIMIGLLGSSMSCLMRATILSAFARHSPTPAMPETSK